MYATQVLPEDLSENIEENDGEQIVGFLLVDEKKYEITKGETKIGRDPALCSIVIENFTVSKIHAVVESEGIDDTFIFDVASTNQTKLGKKVLKPHCRYKLENESILTFGNITAKFILPHKIISYSESKSDLENFNAANDLEDIFDIPTQVSVPQSSTASKVLQLEKISGNFQIFKIPNLVSEKKVNESLGSSKRISEAAEDHLNLVSRSDYCSNSFDTSGIFNLSTQCQIILPSCEKNKCKDEVCSSGCGNNESDKMKSLLNDGQDDVLCTFMSLHSPSGVTLDELPKKIKTEVIEKCSSQLFDSDTQAVLNPNKEKKNEQTLWFDKHLCNQNVPQPFISSTPLSNKLRSNCLSAISGRNNSNTEPAEEDFIKTQEYKIISGSVKCDSSSSTRPDANNVADKLDTNCYLEETTDFSTAERAIENEDLVCTQKFEVLNPQDIVERALENEESSESREDFLETQIYDVEKETGKNISESDDPNELMDSFLETQIFDLEMKKIDKETEKKSAEKSPGSPFLVPESPEKDKSPVEMHIDSTQRNREEDLISTQAFKVNVRNDDNISSNGSPEKCDEAEDNDNEDFIATQPVDLLTSNTSKNKEEFSYNAQTASRESSPDMLDSEFSRKISEDFIQTPTFENSQCKNSASSLLEFSEQIDSMFSRKIKTELNDDFNFLPKRNAEAVESSGDETESDLEIIFDKSDTSKKTVRIEDFQEKSFKAESERSENSTNTKSSEAHESDESGSYVFQLETEISEEVKTNEQNMNDQRRGTDSDSDSDATDCEEIVVVNHKMPIKQDFLGNITVGETQVLVLTPPNDFAQASNAFITGRESPKFEVTRDLENCSQYSLEVSSSRDTTHRLLRNKNDTVAQKQHEEKEEDRRTQKKIKKTEVGTETLDCSSSHKKLERRVDSLLKRPGNSFTEIEALPVKKSKIETSDRNLRSGEKQFLKLWRAHDIEQIQPNRTRNSLKNFAPENKPKKTNVALGNDVSNEGPTSRREIKTKRKSTRKQSYDITSYLCKKTEKNMRASLEESKKETPPKDKEVEQGLLKSCDRVLRSSRSSADSSFEPLTKNPLTKRPMRNSRFKNEDYFRNGCVNVVFTGFDCETFEKIISNLGGKKTNDLSSGDVLVAEKVRRTVKFLCAIGLSLPITSPEWLVSCKAEKKFLNPWNFLLKDEESEKKWDFELKASLEKSIKSKLMQGLNVFATKSAKPPVKDLLAIVECCGGTPLFDPPDIWPKKTVIVSCEEDKNCWPLAKLRNIKIVHYEFILTGVLRQKLDYKMYRLR